MSGDSALPDGLTFERAEQELEQIVDRLERGDVGLDETIALWERGEALYRFCRDRLDAAHGRIEELTKQQDEPGKGA